jgi:hypothetical protein
LQDFFAHSNFVDLPQEDKERLMNELLALDPNSWNNALKFTVLDRSGNTQESQENPLGHSYPHGTMSKDDDKKNDESEVQLPNGRTKHEQAKVDAEEATERFVIDALTRLSPEQLQNIVRYYDCWFCFFR